MNISEAIKALDISLLKVVFLRFYNKTALIDYILGKINTAVNELIGANKEKVAVVRSCIVTILGYFDKYSKYFPDTWKSYADAYIAVVRDIVNATEDDVITSDEMTGLVEKALKLYAMYAAE